jgi:hypothetical protein
MTKMAAINSEKKAVRIPINIVHYYAKKHSVNLFEARRIFDELEIFLGKADHARLISERMVPSRRLDSAWHEFILHTKQYVDYCEANFGTYIHHVPDNNMTLEKASSKSTESVDADCGSCSMSCEIG